MLVFIVSSSPSTADSASRSSDFVAFFAARASEIDLLSAELPTDTCQDETTSPSTFQGISVANNGAEVVRDENSRVTLSKVEKAKLFEC
jgi:hypothetical protein